MKWTGQILVIARTQRRQVGSGVVSHGWEEKGGCLSPPFEALLESHPFSWTLRGQRWKMRTFLCLSGTQV